MAWQAAESPAIQGDIDLNGTNNFLDLGRLAQNLGTTGADWEHGDLNYDGSVNFLDIGLLAQNLNKSTVNTPLAGELPVSQDVPQTGPKTQIAPVTAASGADPAPATPKPIGANFVYGQSSAAATIADDHGSEDIIPGVWTAPPSSTSQLFADGEPADILD